MVARHEMPGMGAFFDIFQAFHAWLPSFSPSGTAALAPSIVFQHIEQLAGTGKS